jgi:hypothetical protein
MKVITMKLANEMMLKVCGGLSLWVKTASQPTAQEEKKILQLRFSA